VQGTQRVKLSFRVSGPLVELPINEGDSVEVGELLAQIDPRDFKVALEKARAEFEKAEADYKRYRDLYEDDAVPLADLDLYRANRDVAKSQLDNAKDNLDYTTLRAPFTGIIGEKFVNNYEYVRVEQEITSINDISMVEIVIDVPESIMATVKKGMDLKLEASFEAAPGKQFPLEVKEVATQADLATQTYKLTLIMPHPQGLSILPGMTASVESHLPPKEIESFTGKSMIAIPSIAVFPDEANRSFVWVVDPNNSTVHKREVQIGSVAGTEDIHITGGLTFGERIVIAGINHLREGMKVQPKYRLMDDDAEQADK